MYIYAKYPFTSPKIFLYKYRLASQFSMSMISKELTFVDSNTNEVKLKLLEEWSPVLSLQFVILALELELGAENSELKQVFEGNQNF
jgi:ubiquitin-protein ligase